ncbi:MAG TPA: hypothetical protein VHT96_12880 [Clostridia bacterium]|nr:hypothetical protein [Clostridia bacterium]
MSSLKLEMRQMFEKHNSMAFLENNSKFEDGLLEKILNLSFASLYSFSVDRWSITAVKTPVLLEKLYKITGDIRVTDSAFALIAYPDNAGQDLELFALSLSCAAKYFCVGCFIIRSFERTSLAREFVTDREYPAAAVICLGCFRDQLPICSLPSNKKRYALKIM